MLLGIEQLKPVRAVLAYVGMRAMSRKALPSGDGHAVVIFPGLASDHQAVAHLKNLCNDLDGSVALIG